MQTEKQHALSDFNQNTKKNMQFQILTTKQHALSAFNQPKNNTHFLQATMSASAIVDVNAIHAGLALKHSEPGRLLATNCWRQTVGDNPTDKWENGDLEFATDSVLVSWIQRLVSE